LHAKVVVDRPRLVVLLENVVAGEEPLRTVDRPLTVRLVSVLRLRFGCFGRASLGVGIVDGLRIGPAGFGLGLVDGLRIGPAGFSLGLVAGLLFDLAGVRC
jgi:hypothetical protein